MENTAHMGEMRDAYRILVGKLVTRGHFGDLDIIGT
jgi:hypothetical protein